MPVASVWQLVKFAKIKPRKRIQLRPQTPKVFGVFVQRLSDGTEHRPHADGECQLLVIDAEGTVNTGAVADEKLTRATLERI